MLMNCNLKWLWLKCIMYFIYCVFLKRLRWQGGFTMLMKVHMTLAVVMVGIILIFPELTILNISKQLIVCNFLCIPLTKYDYYYSIDVDNYKKNCSNKMTILNNGNLLLMQTISFAIEIPIFLILFLINTTDVSIFLINIF